MVDISTILDISNMVDLSNIEEISKMVDQQQPSELEVGCTQQRHQGRYQSLFWRTLGAHRWLTFLALFSQPSF
jgi:hypothetical protein